MQRDMDLPSPWVGTEEETGKKWIPSPQGRTQVPISLIDGFGDRVTGILHDNDDVVCLHFDRFRQEIFYKGHNIRYMPLEPMHIKQLHHFSDMLSQDDRFYGFADSYQETLKKIISEKSQVR